MDIILTLFQKAMVELEKSNVLIKEWHSAKSVGDESLLLS